MRFLLVSNVSGISTRKQTMLRREDVGCQTLHILTSDTSQGLKKTKKALKLQIFKVGKKLAEFELMTIKMIETRKSSSGERQIKRVITSIKKFQHKKLF